MDFFNPTRRLAPDLVFSTGNALALRGRAAAAGRFAGRLLPLGFALLCLVMLLVLTFLALRAALRPMSFHLRPGAPA